MTWMSKQYFDFFPNSVRRRADGAWDDTGPGRGGREIRLVTYRKEDKCALQKEIIKALCLSSSGRHRAFLMSVQSWNIGGALSVL